VRDKDISEMYNSIKLKKTRGSKGMMGAQEKEKEALSSVHQRCEKDGGVDNEGKSEGVVADSEAARM
jgi:hypothetical protein